MGLPDLCDNCQNNSNLYQSDTDQDGIGDVCDSCPNEFGVDSDGDGLCPAEDNCPFTMSADITDTDSDFTGNVCDTDDDNDGLLDVNETNDGTFDSSSDTGSDPLNADTDNDGLNDGDEVNIHLTDPNKSDSDGDGFSDSDELNAGTNPLDSNSSPAISTENIPLPIWFYIVLATLLILLSMKFQRYSKRNVLNFNIYKPFRTINYRCMLKIYLFH